MVCDLKVAEKEGTGQWIILKGSKGHDGPSSSELPRTQARFLCGVILDSGTIRHAVCNDFAWMLPLVIAPLNIPARSFSGTVNLHVGLVQAAMGKSSGTWALVISVISLILSPRIFSVLSLNHLSLNRSILARWPRFCISGSFWFDHDLIEIKDGLLLAYWSWGVTFFVTGCCVRFVNPGTANLLRWLLPLERTSLVLTVFRLQRKGEISWHQLFIVKKTQYLVQTFSRDQAYFKISGIMLRLLASYTRESIKRAGLPSARFFASKRWWIDS